MSLINYKLSNSDWPKNKNKFHVYVYHKSVNLVQKTCLSFIYSKLQLQIKSKLMKLYHIIVR